MPFVYQAPGCLEGRRADNSHRCQDPRCSACYLDQAAKFEECGSMWEDSYVGVYCREPKGHPEEYCSEDVTWTTRRT